MVDMAAFWMCEIAPTEIAGSNALNRNRLSCRQAFKENRVSAVTRAPAARRKLRVLIVDDDHDTADTLARLVGHWEHSTRSAYDGLTALRQAAVQHPDVVLLDLTMPQMDGFQVARQLRLDFSERDCFIIGLAGNCTERTHQECSDAGIHMVLIKPVESFVVETLLMLECERINRQPSHDVNLRLSSGNDTNRVARAESVRGL
jgi:CheY-like chemotaxis protein